MILEFSVENYRSFRDRQTFSMVADEGKKEFPENIFDVTGKFDVLVSAIIYGPNASGKSNFMKAMQALRELVRKGANNEPEDELDEYAPFKFNHRSVQLPTVFEVDFLLKKIRYTYHISIDRAKVQKEVLHFYPEGREARLFVRDGQDFDFGDYLKGQKNIVKEITNENQLFLSKAAKNNMPQLMEVYLYFMRDFMTIPFMDKWVDSKYMDRIARELLRESQNALFNHNFKTLLKSFDTGVQEFSIRENDWPFDELDYDVFVEHDVYDDDNNITGITSHPIEEESTGTQKLFALGGLVIRAIMNGRVIIVDEFERSLHPMISSFIIQMFNNPKINTKGAQLIIATHDTNLLSSNNLRRDQIWIVEKDKTGASEMFSLSDVKGILKGAPYEKWYLSGRFGGVPGIESLNFELNFRHEKEETETADL